VSREREKGKKLICLFWGVVGGKRVSR
jgi:hypothetical protein